MGNAGRTRGWVTLTFTKPKQVGGSLRVVRAQLEKLGRALGAQSRASSPGRRREMSFRPFSSRGACGRA